MEDYLSLSPVEKKQVIRSQIKGIQHSKYLSELNIGMEQSYPSEGGAMLEALLQENQRILNRESYLISILDQLNIDFPEETNV